MAKDFWMTCVAVELLPYSIEGTRLDKDECLAEQWHCSQWLWSECSNKLELKLLKGQAFWVRLK